MESILDYEKKLKKSKEIVQKRDAIARKARRELIVGRFTELGKLWEIPECCIKQFCEESILGIPSGVAREFYHKTLIPKNVGYVPCDKCMGKITNGQTIKNITEVLNNKYKHGN